MATALESASLVMAPCGYEDGTLGSLQPTDGTGDFTFTRGSNLSATRVNAAGNIEKGYENLLLQSNSFGTTPWLQSDATATGGQTGYDGSSDAWLLEKTSSNGRVRQYVTNTSVQTLSAYVKAGTNNWMRVTFGGDTTYFDLANGVLGNDNSINANITSAGNGWYRCTFTANVTSAQYAQFYVADSDGSTSGTSGSIYIQDAMLNQGLVAYPYIETTTSSARGGILENTPRIDYSSGPNGSLLLEPSRTNLIGNSELINPAIDTNWRQLGVNTFTNNYGISPEGKQNSTLIEFGGTNSTYQAYYNTAVTAGAHTISLYAKGSGEFKLGIYDNTSILTDTIIITSEWQRFEVTKTTTATFNARGIWLYPSGDENTIEVWGAQCELGSYATSLIPTYGTSVTRAGEVCGSAGNSSTFNDSEGVLYAEIAALADDSTHRFILLGDGTSQNEVRMAFENFGTSIISLRVTVGGTQQAFEWKQFSLPSILNYKKIAIVYAENRFELWVNGVKERSSSSGSTFPSSTLDRLDFKLASGQLFYGNVKQVVYFPTALSDAALIELTTL